MSAALAAVDAAIEEIGRAQKQVTKIKTRQVRAADDVDLLSSTARAWFRTHRPSVELQNGLELTAVDTPYRTVLDAASRHASKQTYVSALKLAKTSLLALRAQLLVLPASTPAVAGDDTPPDFSPLVGNQEMREILIRRWHECRKCVAADAHLAAIVMMGGLLEALFVARANKMPDKNPLITAAAAPIDKTTGKVANYQDWMLDSYIKVANELKWITDSAKQVSDVLKEYRNYVHPAKELRHKVELAQNDSHLFWQITKEIVRQLLQSASAP